MKFKFESLLALNLVTVIVITTQTNPAQKTLKSKRSLLTRFPPGMRDQPKNPSSILSPTAPRTGSSDFIPVADRIACFDNDGTLWSEKPLPFQLYFVLDRIKAMAPQHPEWKNKQPYKAILEGDLKTAMAGGEKALTGSV